MAGNLYYHSEYIDVAISSQVDYQEALRDFLLRKYERQEFNLIIPYTEMAADFVARYGVELFPGTPVVFLVSREQAARALRLSANSTGFSQKLDMNSTLDLALGLQPGVKRVFVVSGASGFDRYYEEVARRQFQGFEGRLTFTYLSGLPLEDTQKAVANLSQDSIIYFLSVTKDHAGKQFLPSEALEKIAPVAAAPIYGWVEGHVDHGILGGNLLSPEILAHHLAKLALRVLSGERPSDIPVTEVNANINMVDWRQLQRWGISENRLPPGTIVRFKEPTLWEQYKWRIVTVISLCIFQALLIVWLLIHRSRHRRAEEAKDKLAAIVESSQDAILSKSLEGTITSWNAGAEKIYGYSASEIVGRHVSTLAPAHLKEEVPWIIESIRRGESVDHLETVRLTKDGRPIEVSLTISPIRDGRGRIIGASTIARDIMDRSGMNKRSDS